VAVFFRRAVPFAAAGIVLLLASLLHPLTQRAWAPAALPAVVVATWATNWIGGGVSLVLALTGRIVLIDPAPWTEPAWMTSWLVLHVMAIVVTEIARSGHYERRDARRVTQEQSARAAKAIKTRRAEFLAHASKVLASSPNVEATLAAVANLAVPQIADLCVVDLVDEQGRFTPLAVAHVEADKIALVRELRRMYPLDPAAPFGPPRVLRTGRSVVYSHLPDAAKTATPVGPSELRVAVALGIRSTMAVPLLVGGRRLGVISLATTDASGRYFIESDVQFAEDLAHRAAVAIDTAHP
jgi:hypothetical protein